MKKNVFVLLSYSILFISSQRDGIFPRSVIIEGYNIDSKTCADIKNTTDKINACCISNVNSVAKAITTTHNIEVKPIIEIRKKNKCFKSVNGERFTSVKYRIA